MSKIHKTKILFAFGFIISMLSGCGGYLTTPEITRAPTTVVATMSQSVQSTSTPTLITNIAPRPTLTLKPSQSWYFTAVAIQSTEKALRDSAQDNKATKIAQFPIVCEDDPSDSISPNEEWLATSCGYKRDQTLIVQNQEGTKWILEFKDFLSPESPPEIPGALVPEFWSPNGEYLYFVPILGYSGGGSACFPRYGRGEYGLFRLNLKMGTWTTLIPPTDSFNGYGIEFSPTGRRYAIARNSIAVTDINTGEVIELDASGSMELKWSPDGTYLAYSAASCGEQFLQFSSVYVWNASTNQTQMFITMDDGTLLRPVSWSDNSTLRIEGEKFNPINGKTRLTIYIYDITQDNLAFTGTATPSP